jgi:hypothetical protein
LGKIILSGVIIMAMIMKRAENSPLGCSSPSAAPGSEDSAINIGSAGRARSAQKKYREESICFTA